MNALITIENEEITVDQFINFLKLTNEFPELIEKFIRWKLTVRDAKQNNITVTSDEIQETADNFRRCFGLHRAKDTYEWLDQIGVLPEEFESFITDFVYQKKWEARICSNDAIEKYFIMNASNFDKADIRHIVVNNENKAKELAALLTEAPHQFEDFAKKHSLDETTKLAGGLITGIKRGMLPDEIESQIFNGCEGDIIGPFRLNGNGQYEIFKVEAVHPAQLDDSTKESIAQILKKKWFQERMADASVL